MVLPLSYVTLNILALAGLSSAVVWHYHALQPWLWLSGGCAAALLVYVLRGWQLSGIGAQGLLDLARAPTFLLWKVVLMLRRPRIQNYVRPFCRPANFRARLFGCA